jgi:uncharacterized alpha-E superfamily protein
MPLLCRVAENMFWLNRYVERAIAIIRVVDVTAHLELDAGDADDQAIDFWTPLLGPRQESDSRSAAADAEGPQPLPQDIRYYLSFDADNPSSLVSCVRCARTAARQVRDSISSEMWEQINTLYLLLSDSGRVSDLEDDLHSFYREVRDGLLLIQGLADATVAHDEAWQFLALGQYLERADNVSRLLRLQSHLLTGSAQEAGDETVRWLAVLRSVGSAEAYSRYYSLRVEPTRVLEFLLLNPTFPQSIRYSLGAAWSALEAIAQATDEDAAPPVRALGMLHARLEHASVDEILEQGLEQFLTGIHSASRAPFFATHRRPGATSRSLAPRRLWRPSSNAHPGVARHAAGLCRRSDGVGAGCTPRPTRRWRSTCASLPGQVGARRTHPPLRRRIRQCRPSGDQHASPRVSPGDRRNRGPDVPG